VSDHSVETEQSKQSITRRSFAKKALTTTAAVAGLGSAGALTGGWAPLRATKAKSTTLNAIWLGASWGQAAQVMAAQYEKETRVKVNIQLVDRDAIHSKLALSVAGKAPYDIFNIDYSWVPEFGSANQLYSVGDLAHRMGVDVSQFIPRALACAEYDGRPGSWAQGGTLYGLPDTIHPQILWYRKDIYQDAGMQKQYHAATGSTLKPPATMDEWQAQCRFLHGKTFKGTKIYGWADQAATGFGNVHTWLMFLYSFGGQPYDWSKMQPTLTTANAIRGTQYWVNMLKYTPPGSSSWLFSQVMAAAAQGQLATVLLWSWGAYALEQPKSPTKGLWDFVEVPAGTVHGVSHLGCWVNAIPKTAQNSEEAFRFIAWLQNKQNTIKQAQLPGDTYGGDPTRIDAYQDRSLVRSTIPGTSIRQFSRFPAVLRAMEHTLPRPYFPKEEAWEVAITADLAAAQLGQSSVRDALQRAQGHAAGVVQGLAKTVPQPGPKLPAPQAKVSLSALAKTVAAEL